MEPGEVTSNHGFDPKRDEGMLRGAIERLKSEGIRISLFMDAIPGNMAGAAGLGADRVELYTGPYAAARTEAEISNEFARLKESHDAALDAGLALNAGHDLSLDNLPRLQVLPGIKEVSIGHAIISHALYVGLSRAVLDFRSACGQEV